MATPGRRRSVSMRDGEYIALDLYKRDLERNNSAYAFSITGVLGQIIRGEIPPIPEKLLAAGRVRAKLEREERAKNPRPKIVVNTPDEGPGTGTEDMRDGGEIFTF